MKKLWKFEWDLNDALCVGLFKATDEEAENLYGKEIYFGEIAGKHSEVCGKIEPGKITLVSDNPVVIDAMPEIGCNPMDYLSEELK